MAANLVFPSVSAYSQSRCTGPARLQMAPHRNQDWTCPLWTSTHHIFPTLANFYFNVKKSVAPLGSSPIQFNLESKPLNMLKIAFVVWERSSSCERPLEQKLARPGMLQPAQACRQGQVAHREENPLGCAAVAKVGRGRAQGNTAMWGRVGGCWIQHGRCRVRWTGGDSRANPRQDEAPSFAQIWKGEGFGHEAQSDPKDVLFCFPKEWGNPQSAAKRSPPTPMPSTRSPTSWGMITWSLFLALPQDKVHRGQFKDSRRGQKRWALRQSESNPDLHSLAGWPWANCLISLYLPCFLYKWG